MKTGSNVVNGASGVQIRRLAHRQTVARREHIIKSIAMRGKGALRLTVERYPAFAPGCGGAPATLALDQIPDRMMPVADNSCRLANRGRDDLAGNDDDAKIGTGDELLDEHFVADLPGRGDGARDFIFRGQIDEHAATLLAPRRFDDDPTVAFQKRRGLRRRRQAKLLGHAQPGLRDNAARQCLVVATGHRHRAGHFRQRFAACDRAPAIGQPEDSGFGILDLDRDASAPRFFDNNAGIDIDLAKHWWAREQVFVHGVLAFHAEHRHADKPELLVKRDRLLVVVLDGQVHEGAATLLEEFGQRQHKRGADARRARLRIDRQRPQTRAIVGIVERSGMIDANDDAGQATFPILGNQDVNAVGK